MIDIANQCMVSQGRSGGKCVANDGLWTITWVVIDRPSSISMQVIEWFYSVGEEASTDNCLNCIINDPGNWSKAIKSLVSINVLVLRYLLPNTTLFTTETTVRSTVIITKPGFPKHRCQNNASKMKLRARKWFSAGIWQTLRIRCLGFVQSSPLWSRATYWRSPWPSRYSTP
jgi:hypothetical protein